MLHWGTTNIVVFLLVTIFLNCLLFSPNTHLLPSFLPLSLHVCRKFKCFSLCWMKNGQRQEVELFVKRFLQFNLNNISKCQSAIFIKQMNHFHCNLVVFRWKIWNFSTTFSIIRQAGDSIEGKAFECGDVLRCYVQWQCTKYAIHSTCSKWSVLCYMQASVHFKHTINSPNHDSEHFNLLQFINTSSDTVSMIHSAHKRRSLLFNHSTRRSKKFHQSTRIVYCFDAERNK